MGFLTLDVMSSLCTICAIIWELYASLSVWTLSCPLIGQILLTGPSHWPQRKWSSNSDSWYQTTTQSTLTLKLVKLYTAQGYSQLIKCKWYGPYIMEPFTFTLVHSTWESDQFPVLISQSWCSHLVASLSCSQPLRPGRAGAGQSRVITKPAFTLSRVAPILGNRDSGCRYMFMFMVFLDIFVHRHTIFRCMCQQVVDDIWSYLS